MRQVVGLCNAIERRKNLDWYRQLCLHASVQGRKINKSFEEIFEYTEPEEEVSISPEAAKLIEKLQAEHVKRAEDQHAGRKRTTNKN